MSTPKPGQIRCPTCLRSTPPAAFCTQCGSPIPPSALARPRGLDREELEERVRRRPGENAFRRGGSAGDPGGRGGYIPFEPEPEDALAVRGEEEASRNVDNLPPEPSVTRPIEPRVSRGWSAPPPPAGPSWPDADLEEPAVAPPPPPSGPPTPPQYVEPAYAEPEYSEPEHAEEPYEPRAPYSPEAYDDAPYGRPEDAYAYPYQADDGRGGGGNALPIIGFVVLCVIALAVGAVLAGLLGGEEPIGQATPSPTVEESLAPSLAPSVEASAAPSESAGEPTPAPTDGPVAFPDGALLTIQPCGSNGYRPAAVGQPEADACQVDGSSVDTGNVWAFVVFDDTAGADTLTVTLRSGGETINVQEFLLSSKLNDCTPTCGGLVYGAAYTGLSPATYELVLDRNGEFADRASFVVEG